MIDENLPIYFFRPPKERGDFDTQILLAQQGAEAAPAYVLRRVDPGSEQGKNRFAVALFDAFAPDVLYGEILLEPDWTHPTLSMDAIRANGGVAPPAQPVLPNEFTIQLYSPDQQIKVRHLPSSWNSTASWEFQMPQESFRRPSASTLDRGGNDPTAKATTPMINMRWKRMGKFSKDLMCYLTGKSQHTDGARKRTKEPDIPLSFFHHFSELTIYEPNVTRLDIEDPKGFEVATILAATAIRDVYFTSLREAFNINELDIRGTPMSPPRQNSNSSPTTAQPPHALGAPPSGTEARKRYEIEAESAQIRYQLEEEERARKRQEYEDAQKAKLLAEQEQKEEKRRRQEIEKETERLRREWEAERTQIRKGDKPALPPRTKEDKGKKRDNGHHNHNHRQQNSQQVYLGPPQPDVSTPAGVFGAEVQRPKSSLGGGLNIFRSNDDKERKMLKKKSAIW